MGGIVNPIALFLNFGAGGIVVVSTFDLLLKVLDNIHELLVINYLS
jgi:hypothetical protein